MIVSREEPGMGKILENIIFLADVFGEMADESIPDVPILELARSFELTTRGTAPAIGRGGHK